MRIIACIVCSMMTTVMPSRRRRTQHIQHIVAFVAAQPRQRLVQQQQSRRAGQRPRQFHQPKLLVGQLPGGNPGLVSQPDALQRVRGRGDRVGIRDSRRRRLRR